MSDDLFRELTGSMRVGGPTLVSNGNYVDDPMTVQGSWVDGSVGNGVVSFVADGVENVMKLDGGATYDALNLARATNVLSGPAGDRITVTCELRGNWGALGGGLSKFTAQINISATESFRIDVYEDNLRLLGTTTPITDIPITAPSTSYGYVTADISRSARTCDIRLDKKILATGVDCIRLISRPNWNVFIDTFSRETPVYTQRIGLVNWFAIGDNLVEL